MPRFRALNTLVFGPSALVSRKRGRPSNHRLPIGIKEKAITLVRERYLDFGPTLAHEKLAELHDVRVSNETLRKWMAEAGIWKNRASRKAALHQPRNRRESHRRRRPTANRPGRAPRTSGDCSRRFARAPQSSQATRDAKRRDSRALTLREKARLPAPVVDAALQAATPFVVEALSLAISVSEARARAANRKTQQAFLARKRAELAAVAAGEPPGPTTHRPLRKVVAVGYLDQGTEQTRSTVLLGPPTNAASST